MTARDVSAGEQATLDTASEIANALSGTHQVPPAEASAGSTSGSFRMSRRQLLKTGTLSSAAVFGAITADTDDPAYLLWKRWKASVESWSEASSHEEQLRFSMPDELKQCRRDLESLSAELERDEKRLPQLANWDEADRQLFLKRRHVAQEQCAALQAALEATGLFELESKTEGARAAWYALEREMEAFESPTPVAFGAKLHVMLDRQGWDATDREYTALVTLMRPLLPMLPLQMQMAIEGDIRKAEEDAA